MGVAIFFCLAWQPGLERFQEDFEGESTQAFAFMDDIHLGLTGINANTPRAITFLQRGVDGIGIVVNPAKVWVYLRKGTTPTAAGILLLESADVRFATLGEVTVVGVSIGIEKYAVECMVGVVGDGGVDRLARCLADTPEKRAEALIVIEPLGQTTSYLERVLDKALSLQACRRIGNGAQWAYEQIL